jgi:hypothetical protein
MSACWPCHVTDKNAQSPVCEDLEGVLIGLIIPHVYGKHRTACLLKEGGNRFPFIYSHGTDFSNLLAVEELERDTVALIAPE